MSDPLALLPLAVAAHGGTIDGAPASQFIAAGLTLLQRSAPLVRALAGRRTGVLLPTTASFLTAIAASEGRGAVLLNPLASRPELALQIADADVGAVITTSAFADRVSDTLMIVLLDDAPRSARVISAGAARDIDLGSHFALSVEGDPAAEGSAEEAVVVYTSAMHGQALGARLTHRNLLSNARATVDAGELTASDHSLAALPFSHLFGFVASAIAPLLAGGRVTTMSRFHPVRAIEHFERDAVTCFVGVPAMYIAMLSVLEAQGRAPFRAPALRLCICGGAPLDPDVQRRWSAITGTELRQGYGLTEASPVALFNQVSMPNVVGALGTAYPGVEVELRDIESFAPVKDGDTGEICIRGPSVFAGYVTREAPGGLEVRDGWLRSGDLGRRRADGTVEFRGVIKSMFTRNGYNIYPREIERAIGELPGVTSVRVSAMPDPVKENAIVVEVSGAVTVDDVRGWAAVRLGAYKQPSVINVTA